MYRIIAVKKVNCNDLRTKTCSYILEKVDDTFAIGHQLPGELESPLNI